MRILVTADLHYDIARSREPARAVADQICGQRADVLMVLGDVAGRDADIVRQCLRLFDGFAGRKLFVAGNHDIWTDPGACSLERLEVTLPAICRETGFHPLDVEPLILDGVGFVGSMGWYDYSFRPEHLGIPLRFYENKIAPGAAARLARYAHLVEETGDVPEASLRMGTRWMDGEHARLPMGDGAFCDRLLSRFDEHLGRVAARCDRIIVGLHHLPFRELVVTHDDPSWAFGAAFMGSGRFGEALLAEPKVSHAFCAHSHHADRVRVGHVECINVGCTYVEKRYETLET